MYLQTSQQLTLLAQFRSPLQVRTKSKELTEMRPQVVINSPVGHHQQLCASGDIQVESSGLVFFDSSDPLATGTQGLRDDDLGDDRYDAGVAEAMRALSCGDDGMSALLDGGDGHGGGSCLAV